MQSHQDDIFDALETFAETCYIFLVLLARQKTLNPDELYLLDRAAKVAALLPKTACFVPRCGESVRA
jgi:hypothetical protein